ncbi:gluconate 5-dehydrogenase [Maribacter vaceletii]|uniref:Gluconate 5-dehydrogenase n=1 Tax=Maribacter vaceletii TaxID=1206816 RepID=A0A495DTN7_9FLAO|nr:SDR family oxidoreductase [Maribacter vaceletii]RKR07994.1 gluconate 5-dehydrogenase [Maribacter vaceletii]
MNISQFGLKGKTALITGGGSGIGFGIALAYVNAGAKVIIIGRTEVTLQNAISELGENASYYVFDITNQSKIKELIKEMGRSHGAIHILVNNAGIHLKAPVSQTTDEGFLSVIQTHLLSAFTLSREVMESMKKYNVKGSIIMISSMTGIMAMTQVVAYTSAKTAMLGLMRGLLADYALNGIRVNSIAPGWIESKMLHKALDGDAERKNKILNRIPFKNFGKPEDIGNAAIFLGSEASAYINGVLLPVDGGAAVGF